MRWRSVIPLALALWAWSRKPGEMGAGTVNQAEHAEGLENENRELRRALAMVVALATEACAIGGEDHPLGVVGEPRVGLDGGHD